jgi:lipoprotein NlpD
MRKSARRSLSFLLPVLGLLAGCTSRLPAPVIDRSTAPAKASTKIVEPAKPAEFHIVKKGETLYSIALEYGQSYKDVAAWNNIDNPNVIRVGQQLRIAPPEGAAVVRPIAVPAAVESQPLTREGAAVGADPIKRQPKGGKHPYSEQLALAARKQDAQPPAQPRTESRVAEPVVNGETDWIWPSAGSVIGPYVEGSSKGIDIEGRIGEAVLAAAAGKVIYAGNAIRGYGNLLILQHANGLSSVYAHNDKLLVKEGQQVARGQQIAELGSSDTDRAKLHFEIRRQGKPLDPLKLLPPR